MDALAATCEQIANYSARLKKVAILAEYLKLLSDADLTRAVRFLICCPIQAGAGKFSVGGATLRQAAMAATGWDSYIMGLCHAATGDTGETVALLMRGRTASRPMSLAEAELLYARLFKMRRTVEKVELLRGIFSTYRSETLKFFVKVITGNLRIGLLERTVEEAIALSNGTSHEHVRLANNRLGDLARVAVSARHGTLHEIEARLFHPMDFMLAKPLNSVADLMDPDNWWMEDKYDGFRSQIHVDRGEVMIFTRGMDDITDSFPEIVSSMKSLQGSAVIDGEILAWRGGRALPFTVLQQRIARKKMTDEAAREVPVAFIAYDILYRDGRMLIDTAIEDRRRVLVETMSSPEPPLAVAPQVPVRSIADIEEAFLLARERGNEGLLLKRRGSLYEPGKRSGAWQKLKRPYGTLDVVITAAETGSGRRAIWLSDYTFAVRDGERFVNVGKAYSGLSEVEIRELTRILRSVALERFGRVTLVKPEVVLEVAFDGVQRSPRHKGGFALRFPRIIRWRKDKAAADSDTLDRVREMYEMSLASGAEQT
jgi:DNA ligase 1